MYSLARIFDIWSHLPNNVMFYHVWEVVPAFELRHSLSQPPCPDASTLDVRHSAFSVAFHVLKTILGLPPDTQADELKKHFDGYGSIVDCRVMTGKSSRSPTTMQSNRGITGFGFVEFENSSVSQPAMICQESLLKTHTNLGCRRRSSQF
jgi:hypothetical protein